MWGGTKCGNHSKSNAVSEIGVPLDRREPSLYGETVDICSEIHTKHMNALYGQIVEL
jgi:hypothetical protein